MKHALTQLGAAVIMLFAFTLNAQVEGLPELGITLSGTPDNPIVENHSGKTVIGHALRVYSAESIFPLNMNNLKVRDIWEGSKGLEPERTEAPLMRFFFSSTPAIRFKTQGVVIHTPTRVVLDSVVFANGQVAGPDAAKNFEQWSRRLEAIRELATFALEAKQNASLRPTLWSELDRLVALRTGEDLWKIGFAGHMRRAHVRDHNDEAAFDAASRIMSIPSLWRAQ